jgi:hypothetical protein
MFLPNAEEAIAPLVLPLVCVDHNFQVLTTQIST